jgi:hypothetical protein
MTIVRIKDILYFAPNCGVILERGALDVPPEELQKTVQLAFEHLEDKSLVDACCGGCGPLADYHEIQFEDYLQLLKKIEIGEAALVAKRRHTKIRRSHFNSSRSRLVLAMIEAGVPYLCARDSCEVHSDLTIDHITPLSRGGTDDLSNLQFLCMTHNGAKSDKLKHS